MSGTASTASAPVFSQIACDGYFIYAVMSDGTLWYRQRAGFAGTITWTQMTGPTEAIA